MSIGNGQPYLDYMQRVDDEREYRDWQELNSFMTQAERKEYEAWLDVVASEGCKASVEVMKVVPKPDHE